MSQMLHHAFLQSANRFPDRPAITLLGESLTYSELDQKSESLAHELKEHGILPKSRVGIHIEKTIDCYIALLAILKWGCTFVPLDPEYPSDRRQQIVDVAELSAIFHSDSEKISELKLSSEVFVLDVNNPKATTDSSEKLNIEVDINELAYILFTSGSTGTPKGVMISHKNAYSFINWATRYFNYTADDQVAGHSDLMFDLSIMDTFCAWQAGAHLFPVSTKEKMMPGFFIKKNEITIWFSVPSILPIMLKTGQLENSMLASLKNMMFCGEPLKPQFARELIRKNPDLRVTNLYGPTEATIACSVFEVEIPPKDTDKTVSIGFRTGSTEIKILDDQQNPVNIGDRGEIYIVGDQVGPGYWRNPTETQSKFILDPTTEDNPQPCFRTGDIVELKEDGPHFLGRGDSQVKVNGWRIELGDVENAIQNLEDIVESAVIVSEKKEGGDELIAFVNTRSQCNADDLMALLRAKLPSYMIPNRYIFVEDFPRTLNGKLNRKELTNIL